ncbi:MAG: PIN domain-containing protein [Candidatus Aenigmatarchaeota archaeon]
MREVILDTNFLMIPGKFKVDVFHELALEGFEPVTLKNCIEELKKISEKTGAQGTYAKIALEIVEKNGIPIKRKVIQATDNAIIQYAIENICSVATNDRELIERLKTAGIKVVRLRQNKMIVEE